MAYVQYINGHPDFQSTTRVRKKGRRSSEEKRGGDEREKRGRKGEERERRI